MISPPSCVASEQPTAPQTPVPGSLQPRRIGDQNRCAVREHLCRFHPDSRRRIRQRSWVIGVTTGYRFKQDSRVANAPRHGPDMIERFASGSPPVQANAIIRRLQTHYSIAAVLPDGARHGSAQLTTSSRVKRRRVTAKKCRRFAGISVPKPRLKPNALHRPEFDKFYGHDPFLQESVMVFQSMVLSFRKAPWFPIPWSFALYGSPVKRLVRPPFAHFTHRQIQQTWQATST
jgi:hypothetical protein